MTAGSRIITLTSDRKFARDSLHARMSPWLLTLRKKFSPSISLWGSRTSFVMSVEHESF